MAFIYSGFIHFSRGGVVIILIFIVSLVAWYIGVEKYLFLKKIRNTHKKFISTLKNSINTGRHENGKDFGYEAYNILYYETKEYFRPEKRRCSLNLIFREFLISSVPDMERGFSTMSAWISVAPLLGLYGTVAGMIKTFAVITEYGLGNPNLTAQGISVALITTQAGLTVAFPMMLFHNYLVNRSRNLTSLLIKDGEEVVKELEEKCIREEKIPEKKEETERNNTDV